MSNRSTPPAANRSRWFLVLGVFLLAAILRLWGIGHDLPYSYYGDETHFLNRALSFGSGDLNPHWFHKPAFYMYLLFAEYGIFYGLGRLFGAWSSVADFATSYVLNPGAFYLIGRLTTFAFGMGSIWGVYAIGQKHFGKHVGLIAALLLGLTFGHIGASQVIKADIPTTCFTIWSMYFLLNYMQDKRYRSVALTCMFAGLGVATKYYTILMLLPVVAAIFLVGKDAAASARRRWGVRLAALLVAMAAFWGAFFVGSPYNFLDHRGWQSTLKRFHVPVGRSRELVTGNAEEQSIDFIAKSKGLASGTVDYAKVLIGRQGMGVVIGMVCLGGLAVFGAWRDAKTIVFLIFPIFFAMASIVSLPGYAEVRHQTPLYPFLVVSGGVLVVGLANLLGKRSWLAYGALLALLSYPGVWIVKNAIELSKDDTRNIAKSWIEQNIAPGSKLLVDENGPPLLMCEARIDAILEQASKHNSHGQFTAHYATFLKYQRLAAKRAVAYDVHEIRYPWWREKFTQGGLHVLDADYDRDMGNPIKEVGVESYDYYLEHGFQYVIVHSDRYDRFLVKGEKKRARFPAYDRFCRALFARGEQVKRFSPQENGPRGPVVRIYKLVP